MNKDDICTIQILPFSKKGEIGMNYIYRRMYLMQILNRKNCDSYVSNVMSGDRMPSDITTLALVKIEKDYQTALSTKCTKYKDNHETSNIKNKTITESENDNQFTTKLEMNCPFLNTETKKCKLENILTA
ncbi:Uncharacterised protein [Candidatus Tiddalikarchaeum anstoanum]|nr:Uncharacterised protein [Candidatus Tiddalikarchaeum anstoanum]